jgi:hypothetical protein
LLREQLCLLKGIISARPVRHELNTKRKAGIEICRPFRFIPPFKAALFQLPISSITASKLSISSGMLIIPRHRRRVCIEANNASY